MKFYSESLNKLFDTEKDLIDAEAKVKAAEAKKLAEEKAKKEARATKAKEVEKALKEANEAQAKAIKLLKDFTNEYGYFHMSYSTDNTKDKETHDNLMNFFDLVTSFIQ